VSIGGWSFGRCAGRLLAAIPLLSLVLLTQGPVHADAEPEPLAAMVARVSPAVVRVITARAPVNAPPVHGDNKQDAKAKGASATDRQTTAFGSGYIIDPAGYIGTNKHVVDGAISVFVVTADGIRYPAEIVGMAYEADIALLRIDAGRKRLPFVRFGDSDKVRVGDKVIVIGSPFGFDNTVTSGIISAVNRDIMESPFDAYLQTDAAINHGSSGGPVFNLSGKVIGMTSVIFSPDPGSAGVGFAVPSSGLRFVFDRLMKTGEIKVGMLPIHTQPVTWMLEQALGAPDLLGALITSVQSEGDSMSPDRIEAGDIVRTFNGEKVLNPGDLARKVVRAPIGGDAVLEIYRGGANTTAHIRIQASPEAKPVVLNNDGPRTPGLELASTRGDHGQPIVTVSSVDPTGAAADSGIQKGDIIVEVQQTLVSDPDQTLRLFRAQSSLKHGFAAVLVEHGKKRFWTPLAVPE
jgi:serine protease Do